MNLAQDERVSWIQVLDNLRDRGYGDVHVARRLGIDRTRVRKWRENGSELRHDDGERLLQMWSEVMRTHRFLAPRVTVATDYLETDDGFVDAKDRSSAILNELRILGRSFHPGSKCARLIGAACDRLECAVSVMRSPGGADLAADGELPL